MPRTRSLAWSELKIGVLTIAAIVIAVVTIFLLTGERGFPWQRHRLKARFSNVAGLKSGSPVRVAGVEVGTVQAVELVRDEVEVVFDVNSAYRDLITSESTARLGSVSLLGESAVNISPSTGGTPIAEMDYVPSAPAPLQFADLTEQAGTGIEEITNLIRDMRSGRGTAGKLMVDDNLYTQLERFVTTASELTSRLGEDRGTLGRLLNDRSAANALEASLANIETLTRRINAGEGSLAARG